MELAYTLFCEQLQKRIENLEKKTQNLKCQCEYDFTDGTGICEVCGLEREIK